MTKEEIRNYCDRLTQFDTPTISNALECFSDFKRGTGFMDYTIKPVVSCTTTYVGPVATAKIATEFPKCFLVSFCAFCAISSKNGNAAGDNKALKLSTEQVSAANASLTSFAV